MKVRINDFNIVKIDIHDLINLLKSDIDTREHTILKLKEHLLGTGEDVDLYDNDHVID
jgi:hypothetical protein